MTLEKFIRRYRRVFMRTILLFKKAQREGKGIEGMDHERLALRGCGDCSVCCTLPFIQARQYDEAKATAGTGNKPWGEACRHCSGHGCKVYDDRPPVCRDFQCLYRFGITDNRPDKSEVVWFIDVPEETHAAAVAQVTDINVIWKNEVLFREAVQMLDAGYGPSKVAYVLIRDRDSVLRLRRTITLFDGTQVLHAEICKTALNSDGAPYALVETLRRIQIPFQICNELQNPIELTTTYQDEDDS
jgi:hypothetical protein